MAYLWLYLFTFYLLPLLVIGLTIFGIIKIYRLWRLGKGDE